jgi:NlpC/P60 family/Transglycosylase SLT domain
VERAIAAAMSKLGAPYVWATAGPDTFDCSGFTWWVACQVLGPQDYELRSSHHQWNVWGDGGNGCRVSGDRCRHLSHHPSPTTHDPSTGDLVFFDTMGVVVMGNRASHVGLMIDEDRFIHAANEQLGVRIDALRGGWYDGKLIGSGRIFGEAGKSVSGESASGDDVLTGGPLGTPAVRLTDWLPDGPIRTQMPWSGRPPGAEWSDVGRWARELEEAAGEHHLDPRLPAAVMALETQGIHERDGTVIEVADHHPEDGPSVGLMQVKPRVWQWLAPEADAYDPAGNIRLGTAALASLIGRYGSWERAIARGYHPGVSPNGTTPARYVKAMRGLLGELGYAG